MNDQKPKRLCACGRVTRNGGRAGECDRCRSLRRRYEEKPLTGGMRGTITSTTSLTGHQEILMEKLSRRQCLEMAAEQLRMLALADVKEEDSRFRSSLAEVVRHARNSGHDLGLSDRNTDLGELMEYTNIRARKNGWV